MDEEGLAGRLAALSPAKRAWLAERLQTVGERIAVVGMGCRLPGGASTPDGLWRLLCNGEDAIKEVPPERWDVDAFYDPDPDAPGKMSTRWGGFLDDVDRFDADFFRISPREASRMDPQQRVLLEVAWETFEDAGLTRHAIESSATGVFVGICSDDYYKAHRIAPEAVDAYTGPGSHLNIAAGRISYVFDLRGPSLAVDTACSASLTAVFLACESLRRGECEVAVAGGVNLILWPLGTIGASRMRMMAADGRCKAFDARADGYVRSEGCGLVALRPLSAALAAGDRVYAVIDGWAINHDGRSAGLTAPSVVAQQDVIRRALARARLQPEDMGYVEAHGTGTPLGDPIEFEALIAVLGRPRHDGTSCAVGSVKTNLGHCEGASGIAGLMKCALSLHHGAIPGSLHLRDRNARIDLEGTPLEIPTRLVAWPRSDRPRHAGVSSFGWSGTNVHAVLSEAPGRGRGEAPCEGERDRLLALSGCDPAGLRARAEAFREVLKQDETSIADLCFTAGARRTHHEHRLVVCGRSTSELVEKLDAFLRGEERRGLAAGRARDDRGLVFVFSGQGSQWLGMGCDLQTREPVFREALERCDAAIRRQAGWSLLGELAADPGGSRLERVDVIQPAIFAMQVATAALWRAWGIEPDAVVGHSMGEIAAAHVAGALELEDAVRVVVCRSRCVLEAAGSGGMVTVALGADALEPELRGARGLVSIAARNHPSSSILSGEPEALRAIVERLERRGVFCGWIKVDYASHGPQMDPLQDGLSKALVDIRPRDGSVPMVSTVSATRVEGARLDAGYWARNLRQPVRFWEAIESLLAGGHGTFLEVSPHPVLTDTIREGLRLAGRDALALGSLRRGEDELESLLEAAGVLHVHGHSPDFATLAGGARTVVTLPSHPWQRERFWLDASCEEAAPRARGARGLLARRFAPATDGSLHFWEGEIDPSEQRYLRDHRVGEGVVLPASAFLEMALTAAQARFGAAGAIESLGLTRPMPLPESARVTVQLVAEGEGPASASIRIASRPTGEEDAAWVVHAEGRIVAADDAEPVAAASPPERIAPDAEPIAPDDFYASLEARGLDYGPAFRGIRSIRRDRAVAVAEIALPEELAPEAADHAVHPALLDAALQAVGALALDEARAGTWVPVGFGSVRRHRPVGVRGWAVARPRSGRGPDSGSFEADVSILDDEGRLRLELRDVRLRALDGEAEASVSRLLFSPVWRRAASTADGAPHDGAARAAGEWLILADASGAASTLARGLDAEGGRCRSVAAASRFAQLDARHFEVDPASRADLERVVADVAADGGCRGVVYLWGLDDDATDALTSTALERGLARGCLGALHLVQALASADLPTPPRVWIVTRGAALAGTEGEPDAVMQAPLWGLRRAVALEHPELRCAAVDLDGSPREGVALLGELLDDGAEDEVVLRGGERWVRRLCRHRREAVSEPVAPPEGRDFRLDLDAPGVLDDLRLRACRLSAPGRGEVEVRVEAAGLNFRDVLVALGAVHDTLGTPRLLGGECSGTVSAIGEGVTGVAVGDTVVALAAGSFGSRVIAPEGYVAVVPAPLTAVQAAGVSQVFMTAVYALEEVARLRPGERVLIHAAAGGVGLAAVQVARRAGARILATAGSPEKRARLRDLGVEHVSDSRSLAFADEILEATGGEGVDVVLNSLSGRALDRSLGLLAPYGRFLELGKRDILDNRRIGLAPFLRNVSYAVIDLASMALDRPARFAGLLREVMARFERGELEPLPVTTFPISRAPDAFRHMAQARHVGKVVVSLDDPDVRVAPERREPGQLHEEATYLVTGGLGALGLAVSRWMVARGARRLALLARSGPDPEARAALEDLRRAGAEVTVVRADVADSAALQRALEAIRSDGAPLRGVIHAAGLLEDGLLQNLDAGRLSRVLAPKVLGAWNLHALTLEDPLDFFLLFSSAASLLGSPGQANYCAANAFLDALAHSRRRRGRPATSIDWGPWRDIGLAAARGDRGERLASRGVGSLSADEGLAALGVLLGDAAPQVAVLDLDPQAWREIAPAFADLPLFAELGRGVTQAGPAGALRLELEASGGGAERRRRLLEGVREQVGRVLRLAPARVDPDRPLADMGLDSLMMLELRRRLEGELGVALAATFAFNHPTPAALVPYLAERAGLALEDRDGADRAPVGEAAAAERREREERIERLGSREAETLLARRLDAVESRLRR